MNNFSRNYKLVICFMELMLAFPVIGASIVISSGWTVLSWMILFHIIGIILSTQAKQSKSSHIFGLISNIVAVIPFVGMVLHGLTALYLLTQAIKEKPAP